MKENTAELLTDEQKAGVRRAGGGLGVGFLALSIGVGSVAIGSGIAASVKRVFFKTPFSESFNQMFSGIGKWTLGGVALVTAIPSYLGLKSLFVGNQQRIYENMALSRDNIAMREQLNKTGQIEQGQPIHSDTAIELAHTQQSLTNVSHELEVVTNHATKLNAPAQTHAEQAAMDKAAIAEAAPTIH